MGDVDMTTLPPNSMNDTEKEDVVAEYPEVMQLPWVMAIFITLYTAIFIVGVFGNSIVVFVVMRNKAMQTITNIFITNLAISDILMCLLAVPFTPLAYFMNTWIFGDVFCHIVPMVLGISVYVSTLTSTAIAVDRYFVIIYPFKPRMKVYMCLLMIVAVWIIAISISIPLGIYQKVTYEDEVYKCREFWPRQQARQFFTVTSLVLQYIVPCSIITFCYTKVSLALKKRSKTKIGSGSKSRERDEIEIRRKRRTNKMLIAMVTIFVCCWLPLNIIHLILEYHKDFQYITFSTFLFFSSHVVAMSSTIYNPFLYAWMNDNFKKEFKQVLPCLFRGGRETVANGATYTQYTQVETHNSVTAGKSPQKDVMNNEIRRESKAYFESETETVRLNVPGEKETVAE